MHTQCTPDQMEFQEIGRRQVVAAFDGGHISSDGGALLLREADARLKLIERFAACFSDHRQQDLIEHRLEELLRQRIFGLALGYEDLNDHDDLYRDPLLGVAVGKKDPEGHNRVRRQDKGKVLAAHSTLNRLELTPERVIPSNRYWKVVHHPVAIEELFVTLFLESFPEAPVEIILDFDATDDLIHGEQEGRFFHGYYGDYCYLPLYVFCGDQILVARLRTSDRDASAGSVEVLAYLVERIRARWPHTRIVARADSGFARDEFMDWCENHGIYYVLGLAKNVRLLQKIGKELVQAKELYEQTQQAARVFTDFLWSTRKSWTRQRRVIAKAEHLSKGANPRFIVTNLPEDYAPAQRLYEDIYCARGEMENRIKEQQLDLFADRTSAQKMRANQLRLWFSSLAYVLMSAIRRLALNNTQLAKATCGTIRLKLLKIGAQIRVSVRRIWVHLASACPYQDVFLHAWSALRQYPMRT